MKLDERDLRDAFRDTADATPVPDRWEAIVAGSARARRRRTITYTGSAVLAIAASIAVAVIAIGAIRTSRFKVQAGAAHHEAVANFRGGTTVALGKLASGRLAFVSDSHLFVVDADSRTARQLTKSGDASALTWSADGEWLAFSVRNAPGYEDYTTWITRAEGSDARPLDGMSDTFAWSPTGHQLAIAGFCCSDLRGGLFVVDAEHGKRQIVPQGSNITTVKWAPDGKTLGYTANAISGLAHYGVFSVGADGTNARRVVSGQLASWSPDGRSLLVNRDANVELVRFSDGTRRVLGRRVLAFDPPGWSAFSAQGDRVAFIDFPGDGVMQAIVVCHADGTACRRLTNTEALDIAGPPSFSPDGTQITFVSNHALHVVTIANGTVRTLENLGRDLLQGAGDGVHITRGAASNAPVWLNDGTILYRRGDELRVFDPSTATSAVVASPIGFADPGNSGQGLPGGTPTAADELTTNLSH